MNVKIPQFVAKKILNLWILIPQFVAKKFLNLWISRANHCTRPKK